MPAGRAVGGERGRRGDRGQVAIEFVGTVPLILLLVAAVWECVLIGYAFSLAGNAADEAARAGAVHGPQACQAAAQEHIGAAWGPKAVCVRSGDIMRAKVTLGVPVFFPGLDFGEIDATGGAALEKEAE
ncbi:MULTISPECIES: TadE/TadG family type IV pilus assembly protein [unclassified Streptomyces]|uniref:TadE/TadG family type IV pilus assembly protein n=1 Tax=unclassified Streptomyces TaxID=2593676 RepID=UPI0004AAC015|nr:MULTISPECIES: TadE/TadG family type IV pilus assembly protein [unclassified Streptomyces]APU41917.1 septum formation initiator [Streptomyces sp. TN58]KJK45131.1 septum formation initiator [Streptomyces sp. NRRL F-4428]